MPYTIVRTATLERLTEERDLAQGEAEQLAESFTELREKYDLLMERHLTVTSKIVENLRTRGVKSRPFSVEELEPQPLSLDEADARRAKELREQESG